MELKGNGGIGNNYTEINIGKVENVNPNVEKVEGTFVIDNRPKDLPKWKKVTDGRFYDQGFTIDEYDNGRKVLCIENYEINIKELWEKLPKEE